MKRQLRYVQSVWHALISRVLELWSGSTPPGWLVRSGGLQTKQAGGRRAETMKEVLSSVLEQENLHVLEIGTWFGEGSTTLFLEELSNTSTLWLLDSWRPFTNDSELKIDSTIKKMSDVTTTAMVKTLTSVMKREKTGGQASVIVIRGSAEKVLVTLKDALFDIIYIDGSHYYEDVAEDIRQAQRLVKRNGGIVCGDDLEIRPDARLLEIAHAHKNSDFIMLDGTTGFHPGVALAVSENFKSFTTRNGFWYAVRDTDF